MSRTARPFTCLAFLISCLTSASVGASAGEFQPTWVDEKIRSELHGIWASRGYGWVIEIGPEGPVRAYDVSESACTWEELPREELRSFARLYSLDGGTVKLTDELENTTVYTFDRIERVPAVCSKEAEGTPPAVLQHFGDLMAEHYAFFDLYGVDWEARRAEAAARVTSETSETELFEILEEMLEGMRDGHLRLTAEIEGERRVARPGRAALGPILGRAFEKQRRFKDIGRFQGKWLGKQRKQVKKMLGKSYRSASDGQVEWGRVGRIGYLAVFGMGAFSTDEEATMREELAAVHSVMRRVVNDLADTDAMVVDMTLNGGGYDRVSLAIAEHFTDSEVLACTKVADDAEGAEPQPFTLHAAEHGRYLEPVTLLTSNYTVSAAEIFAMAMRALPTVTHRGETTRGALSDVLEKELANGWVLTLSNEIYLDSEGILWEGKGIPPSEAITVFDPARIETSRREAIRTAMAQIEKELE